jgi:hypothetical protein
LKLLVIYKFKQPRCFLEGGDLMVYLVTFKYNNLDERGYL